MAKFTMRGKRVRARLNTGAYFLFLISKVGDVCVLKARVIPLGLFSIATQKDIVKLTTTCRAIQAHINETFFKIY